MVDLTFYGGINEIGGNKILLEDRKIRVLLDFGFSFSKNKKFHSEFLQPRLCNGIGDFLDLGIIPDIDGIYRNDLLKNEGRKTSTYPQINGVVLTHAHADHAWHISLLHEGMPIHCGVTTKVILKSSQETGLMPYYGDFYWFRENFINRSRKPERVRNFKIFKTGEKIRIGGLEIEPVHVDHSIPGAYGLIIHTSSGDIVYTGDLRIHGPMEHFTEAFIERASKTIPEVLICEGTRIHEQERGLSEKEVFYRIKEYITNTKNLVVCNFSIRDIDRFKTFYLAAKESGRKFTLTLKQAYLLKTLRENDRSLALPDIEDDNIAIYLHREKWGRFEDDDYRGWEREFLRCKNAINFEDIHRRPKDFIFYCDYYSMNELIDVKPEEGSSYIYSLSEPHDEEQEIDFKRMKNWLGHFNLKYLEAHSSGHACQKDIKELIEKINPKKVIPVHTEHQELFENLIKNLIYPKLGKRIEI